MNLEIIRKRYSTPTLSGVLPSTAYPIGKPLMIDTVDAGTGKSTFVIASGRCDGFMTRASRATTEGADAEVATLGNPRTPTEQLMGWGQESPFIAGQEGSIEKADALDVEGADYIFKSGTGEITTGTAVGTKLSFTTGKFYVAQAADIAQFRLAAQMTPKTSGDVRIRVEAIEGYLVP